MKIPVHAIALRRVGGAPRVTIHLICVMPVGACLADNGSSQEPFDCLGGQPIMKYTEALRLLAINDAHFAEACVAGAGVEPGKLDPKALALIRIAALVAVGGAVPSYGAEADAAVSAGATAAEIVDVLVAIAPVVGLPCIVEAAPKLAMALGYDVNDALEHQAGA